MRKILRLFWLILIAAFIFACMKLVFIDKNTVSANGMPEAADYVNTTDILLVNANNPLPEGYAPDELVNLYEQKRHFLLATSDIYLEREAFEAANRMFKKAEDENMNGFIITSGYRSYEKQAEIYAEQTDGTAQLPGHSEHETGLAFDVTSRRDEGGFETTEHFAWLMENCWDFGFILRYPEDKVEITGISYEPWHYRYVGVDIAQEIYKSGLTLEEYLYSISLAEARD